jgi:hypothetical protein
MPAASRSMAASHSNASQPDPNATGTTVAQSTAAIPLLNNSKPWTTWLVVYWTLTWVTLLLSFVWTVYTLDVWPLAVWCALGTTAVVAVHG